MTREEVHAIFGKPPGIYSQMRGDFSVRSGPQVGWTAEGKWEEMWHFNDGTAFVDYDSKDGKVESGTWHDHHYYHYRSILEEFFDIISGREKDRKQSPV